MKMGRERNILRWDIHAQLLTERMATIDNALGVLGEEASAPTTPRGMELTRERHLLQKQLAALGPSPRAKMG